MNLALAKSEMFGNVQCDFWRDESNEIWMTRDQIGTALEYADPRKAISNIHERYKDRLDKFSGTLKMRTPSGMQDTVLYTAKGVYEICRWSRQPKADEFYDMVYDLLESLRKGNTILVGNSNSKQELEVKRMNAEARLLNARTRHIMMRYKMISGSNGIKPGIALAASIELTNKELGIPAETQIMISAADYETGKYGATQIAEKIGIKSGIEINKRLEELGFQYLEVYTRKSKKTGEDKTEKAWRLTDVGKNYAEEFPFVKNGHSGYQIKWSEKVIEILTKENAG